MAIKDWFSRRSKDNDGDGGGKKTSSSSGGGGGLLRNWSWKRTLISVGVGLLILAAGLIAGYFIGDNDRAVLGSNRSGAGSGSSQQQSSGSATTGRRMSRADALQLRELPPPGTPAAAALLARMDDGATGGGASDDFGMGTASGDVRLQYEYAEDARLITEALTATFLKRLASGASGVNATSGEAIAPFVRVARDVLSYLRDESSVVILGLLRAFARTGTVPLTDADPDALRAEVDRLIADVGQLNNWYNFRSNTDVSALRSEPPPAQDDGGGGGKRRLLLLSEQERQHRRQRRWRSLLGSSSSSTTSSSSSSRQLAGIEAVPAGAAGPPAASPVQAMADMLCSVASFNPGGIAGITLPPPGGKGPGSAPLTCDAPPALGLFRDGKAAFKPVTIPIVFHVQRFKDGATVQPVVGDAASAGANLVAIANARYRGTGVSFSLREVRSDPAKYPYLLLATRKDWQACVGNPSEESAGFPCLSETAAFPDVAAVAAANAINVFVSGSNDPATGLCGGAAGPACDINMYLGYCRAFGPWFAASSPTWKEGSAKENWIFMTFDQFNPAGKNAARFWDGGGATLAHELGHYLGLMHTHEGRQPCEGDGATRADAVPDTAANLQVDTFASAQGLLPSLAGWCSDWRSGRTPATSELLPFSSCSDGKPPGKRGPRIDNVFNLMSYLPDACTLVLTPNQVARIQWAIATHRPAMMAAFS